jgi:hypothetical protein
LEQLPPLGRGRGGVVAEFGEDVQRDLPLVVSQVLVHVVHGHACLSGGGAGHCPAGLPKKTGDIHERIVQHGRLQGARPRAGPPVFQRSQISPARAGERLVDQTVEHDVHQAVADGRRPYSRHHGEDAKRDRRDDCSVGIPGQQRRYYPAPLGGAAAGNGSQGGVQRRFVTAAHKDRRGIRRVGPLDEQAADVAALAQVVVSVGAGHVEVDRVGTLGQCAAGVPGVVADQSPPGRRIYLREV